MNFNLPPHLMNLQINNPPVIKPSSSSQNKNGSIGEFQTIVTSIITKKEKSKNKLPKVSSRTRELKKSNALKKKWKVLRKAGGEVWEDTTLDEWPENDFRIFCGDLGNEVSDEILSNSFRKYSSFQKARVIRDKRTGKTKGFGFVSFSNSDDYIKAMREMNGKYVGNRPIRMKRSTWKDRSLLNSKSKVETVKFKTNKKKIKTKQMVNNGVFSNNMQTDQFNDMNSNINSQNVNNNLQTNFNFGNNIQPIQNTLNIQAMQASLQYMNYHNYKNIN